MMLWSRPLLGVAGPAEARGTVLAMAASGDADGVGRRAATC